MYCPGPWSSPMILYLQYNTIQVLSPCTCSQQWSAWGHRWHLANVNINHCPQRTTLKFTQNYHGRTWLMLAWWRHSPTRRTCCPLLRQWSWAIGLSIASRKKYLDPKEIDMHCWGIVLTSIKSYASAWSTQWALGLGLFRSTSTHSTLLRWFKCVMSVASCLRDDPWPVDIALLSVYK